MRTGSEPITARSALRMRFWLSLWGLAWSAAGIAIFSLLEEPGWAAACGVLLLIVIIDLCLVVRHIHQGPHYQPGRDVPPYEPVHEEREPGRRRGPRPPSGPRPDD
ncbi:DUF6343 family protein [Streptomyces albipurpureus]|uniref:DUF6343 family protein n=1 Tax=Streptomyces albipurpureus TaxID=2897419 RepID=A0ABT0UUF6_9ACTN|nr:DUF6343 family protein [Streptomyces sp. CWNU-1]MCM2390821.1 DUF6343 family protein [Streptomyces sp. CWNU-1]